MASPQLSYPLTTMNCRVGDLGGLKPQELRTVNPSRSDRSVQIEQAYRQIFFHAMKRDRDEALESQMRDGSITMRDFIRGLLLSRRFQEGYVACSSNYRLVDQLVGRVLGRSVHGECERISWSIVIGEKGFTAFVDALLDSSEYMDSFGYDLVPQQRSRLLPGRALGETPIYQQFPRYGADWRDALQDRAPSDQAAQMQQLETSAAWVNGQPPAFALRIWLGLALVGGFELGRVVLTIALAMAKS